MKLKKKNLIVLNRNQLPLVFGGLTASNTAKEPPPQNAAG
ncbi:hypothetical protein N483_20195 [Pseudoalteromonas luteoviolacea NCIMB 1944]|uniref:Uncharacterized protein n=1 Tax=Pseudoalteromonas luteoviolacea (strain 2ta16) TaxID=1353533 RepID=V4HJH9_PSEL2|nr:hypothetical protein PL2TA16_01356 [Pseudoalteromonas luteoviolacea 2ta16]KZN38278.1 hypothetical protein N483_20195 [Pseudoalteromonas luteoviolacea NCIMB 1944]